MKKEKSKLVAVVAPVDEVQIIESIKVVEPTAPTLRHIGNVTVMTETVASKEVPSMWTTEEYTSEAHYVPSKDDVYSPTVYWLILASVVAILALLAIYFLKF
jgi:hypothetical protein